MSKGHGGGSHTQVCVNNRVRRVGGARTNRTRDGGVNENVKEKLAGLRWTHDGADGRRMTCNENRCPETDG